MFEKGLCKGCYKHASLLKKALCVDHNHTTGKIRGLLCAQCNVCIGMSHDSSEVLRRLAEYLDLPTRQ